MTTLVSVLFALIFWGFMAVVRLLILATAERYDDIYIRRQKAVGDLFLISGLFFIQAAFILFL